MDDRPQTGWEARVARAKREGTWFLPDEEPSPYAPRVKRIRFWTGFASTLVVAVVLGVLAHLVLGRPGSPLSGDVLIDGLVRGLFPAAFVGWSCTRPPRKP